MCVSVSVAYLCDHGKTQDEEDDTADESKDRFVFPQVFGELVRHRGYDGLNGGKLEGEGGRRKNNWRKGERYKEKGEKVELLLFLSQV